MLTAAAATAAAVVEAIQSSICLVSTQADDSPFTAASKGVDEFMPFNKDTSSERLRINTQLSFTSHEGGQRVLSNYSLVPAELVGGGGGRKGG